MAGITAEELAQGAAATVKPELFEPAIRKAADDFYEQLLTGVQDYLKDNVEFNISSHILMLESTIRTQRAANAPLIEALQGILEIAECWASLDGGKNIDLDASDAVSKARAAIALTQGTPHDK